MNKSTITEVAAELLASPQAPTDCSGLTYHVGKFVEWLDRDIPVDELTPEIVNDFIRAIEACGISAGRAAIYRYHVQAVWRFGNEQGYCDTLPVKNPPKHHASEQHVPTPLKPKPPEEPKKRVRYAKPTPRCEMQQQLPVDNGKPLTFPQYAEKYLSSRATNKHYAQRIRSRVRLFCEWYGEDILVKDVTCDIVNMYITALQESTELAATSVNGYRGDLRAPWFDAYELGYNEHPPLRLRRVPNLREAVEAFTHEEIAKLLKAAGALPDFYPNGIKRSDFWRALILAAYSTGLRRGDLLTFPRKLILPSRVATIKQRKTGFPVVVKFSAQSVEAMKRIRVTGDERAFVFPYNWSIFGRHFKRLVKRAGVRPGTFKWLRRAAGSYAETLTPGGGARLLGHRDPNVFNNHYRDDTIVQEKPIEPPDLGAID